MKISTSTVGSAGLSRKRAGWEFNTYFAAFCPAALANE